MIQGRHVRLYIYVIEYLSLYVLIRKNIKLNRSGIIDVN